MGQDAVLHLARTMTMTFVEGERAKPEFLEFLLTIKKDEAFLVFDAMAEMFVAGVTLGRTIENA